MSEPLPPLMMSTLDATRALGVSPQVLRLWVQTYGLPRTYLHRGRRRLDADDVFALRRHLLAHRSAEFALQELARTLHLKDGHRDGDHRPPAGA